MAIPKLLNRLLNTLTLISLLAFLLISASLLHEIRIDRSNFRLALSGDLTLATGHYIKVPGFDAEHDAHWHTWLDNQARFITWQEPGESTRRWELKLPLRFLIPATAALPFIRATIWLILFRRFVKRVTAGKCARCGYDLRATRAQCPECGLADQGHFIAHAEW
jgi:hypothetical protein